MASPQVVSIPAKLSFAKVVAMPAPNAARPNLNPPKSPHHQSGEFGHPKLTSNNTTKSIPIARTVTEVASKTTDNSTDVEGVTGAIEGLALVRDASLGQKMLKTSPGGESTEDDQSHLSNSSSKPQSFDTKSMASVTTFAMDEKESIRPDDSASVRAAEEEESITASHLPTDVHGTAEQAVMAARANSRFGVNAVTIAARRYPSLALTNPPRFGDLPVGSEMDSEDVSAAEAAVQPAIEDLAPVPRFPTLIISPDEKLLEALATPKDRLPLLQLEERVLSFLAQSSDGFLDLPPQNSFARLLAHKLADYYGLEHHINDDNSSVRMYKTACSTLPTPLSEIAQSISIGPAPPPGAATFKIMRRTGYGNRQFSAECDTPTSSSIPSKATSETGAENSDEGIFSPLERTPARDKSNPTREERELKYRQARERIFGDFQEPIPSETTSTGDTSTSISRSSSSSGKRKNRRQKTPKDDSFEARSSFVPGYPGVPLNGLPNQYQPPFVDPSYHNNFPNGPGSLMQTMNYGSTPTQAYPGFDSTFPYNAVSNYIPNPHQQYGTNEAWATPQTPQSGPYYNYGNVMQGSLPYPQNPSPMSPPIMNPQYGASTPSNIPQPNQNWMMPTYPNSYPQMSGSISNGQSTQWQGYQPPAGAQPGPPYQYGQLPPQTFGKSASYSNQHPVPGSYTSSRTLFNPQTRAFVPGNPVTRSTGRNRKKGQGAPTLIRNGSNASSMGSEAASTMSNSHRGTNPINSNVSSPKPREDSLQQKYGAPAHLPKKPPPSEVPSVFDLDGAAMTTHQGGPLVVNGAGGTS